jgi:hypothetical protein
MKLRPLVGNLIRLRWPDAHWFDHNILVAPELRYAYFDIPKVASTTTKALLLANERGDDTCLDLPDEQLHEEVAPLRRLSQLAWPDVGRVLLSPRVFRFAFVRNPYARLLSAYLDLGQRAAGFVTDVAGKAEPTFEEFVRGILQQPDDEVNIHWRSQRGFLGHGVTRMSFVGRMETYEADVRTVLDRLFPQRAFFRSLHRNRTSAQQRLREFYTPELIELVYQRYRGDFELFGYPRELPSD